MSKLLKTVGFYLDVARITMSEKIAIPKLVLNLEVGIKDMPHIFPVFINISGASVNVSSRADD